MNTRQTLITAGAVVAMGLGLLLVLRPAPEKMPRIGATECQDKSVAPNIVAPSAISRVPSPAGSPVGAMNRQTQPVEHVEQVSQVSFAASASSTGKTSAMDSHTQKTRSPAELLPDESVRARLYARAEEIERKETKLPDGRIQRARILKTDMKYPLIQVEETVATDPATGRETVSATSEIVADHVMVKVRPEVDEAGLKAAAERHGMQIRKRMYAPGMYLVSVPECHLGAVQTAMAALGEERRLVKYAEPDSIVYALDTIPNDPGFGMCWGLRNNGQMASTASVVVEGGSTFDPAIPMAYSPPPPAGGVSGRIYDCGYGGAAADFPAEVNGNIAVIKRGGTNSAGDTLTFAVKTANAKAAGARAAIIYNNTLGSFNGTLGGPGDWIPVVGMTDFAGQVLVQMYVGVPALITFNATMGADIRAPAAWDITQGSRSVLVGVIDTGIDYNHPDLAPNIWMNPGETGLDANGKDKRFNGIDDDGNGFVDDWRGWDFCNDDNDPLDDFFHGTHCAGTIGAVGNNGLGVAGVNWRVSLVGLKFLSAAGSGANSDALDAVYYATRLGVSLTSNSWGSQPGMGFSQAFADGLTDADQHGILFVAAAGNTADNDNDLLPSYPASYANSNVIAVAATDSEDKLASFSCFGATTVDLGAPGVMIYSTYPTYMTEAMTSRKESTNYCIISGTSMATPHVAGACALLKAANSALTGAQIKAKILNGVDPISALQGKTVTGGRLNAFRALEGIVPGPYLACKETAIDDDGAGGTSGNGDGIANPGERIGLDVVLRNMGRDPASGVSAVLSLAEADPYVSIAQATAGFGDIPSCTDGTGGSQYLLDVASSTPVPHAVPLVLTIRDTAGHAWTNQLRVLTVYITRQIAGTVTLDGLPLEGATVTLTSGPLPVTRVTKADGSYLAGVIDGIYQVAARRGDYLAADPVTVSVPPSRGGVNFAFTTATINGRVLDDATGQPIAGATVQYRGALSGSVLTAPDGSYSVRRVYGRPGTLWVTATKTGVYVDSDPVSVTVPPSVAGVDFRLGFPDIGVSPSALNVEAEFGQILTRSLTVTNKGLHDLTWSVEVGGPFGETRKDFVIGPKFSSYWGVASDGNVVWVSDGSRTIQKRDPNTGAVIGSLSVTGAQSVYGMAWDGSRLWIVDQLAQRIYAVDPASGQVLKSFVAPYNSQPTGVAVGGGVVWSDDVNDQGTVFKLDPETGALVGSIRMPIQALGITYFNGALWAAKVDPVVDGKFKLFDLQLCKLDPKDGALLKTTIVTNHFEYPINNALGIGNNNKDGLWLVTPSDEAGATTPGHVKLSLFGTGELNGLWVNPMSGTVAGRKGCELGVTLDSVVAGMGAHNTTIHIRSNDPDQPVVDVPVNFTVTATRARVSLTADNAAPRVNDMFTVAVNLRTAPAFRDWGEFLKFDPAKLQLVSQTGGVFSTFIPDSRDLSGINGSGEVRAGGCGLANNEDGRGTLGLFTFKALTEGTTTITTEPKSTANLFGNALHPLAGGEILPVADGSLSIAIGSGGPGMPTILLSADNTAPAVGGTFNVAVNLQNAPGFENWGEFLRFDKSKLELVSQSTGSFASFIPDSRAAADVNAVGEIRAGGSGLTDNAGGNGTLGVFTFKTLAAGTTMIAAENKSATNLFGNVLQMASGSAALPNIAGPLTITVGGSDGNRAPTATASASPTNGLAPLVVNFSATGSDPDGDALSYSWAFGDGTSSSTQNPIHTYASSGSYTSVVTASDGKGGMASASVTVVVLRPNQPPTMTASANRSKGGTPLIVSFSADASDPDGDALTYSWTFGDGMVSTISNPSHRYAASGNYMATVAVDDGHGGTANASVPIYAWPEVRIVDWEMQSNAKFAIRWDGPTGVFYRVQATTNLAAGFGNSITNHVLGSLPLNCHTVTVNQARQMFLRVAVETEAGPTDHPWR